MISLKHSLVFSTLNLKKIDLISFRGFLDFLVVNPKQFRVNLLRKKINDTCKEDEVEDGSKVKLIAFVLKKRTNLD